MGPLRLGAMLPRQSESSLNNCVFLVGPGRVSEARGCDSSNRLEIPGGTSLHHLPQTGGSPGIGNGALGFFKRLGRGAEAEDDCKAPSSHQGAITPAARQEESLPPRHPPRTGRISAPSSPVAIAPVPGSAELAGPPRSAPLAALGQS